MNIKEKQYIFWDLDGTLTDSAEGITNCVKYALESFGIKEDSMDKLRKFIGPPLLYSFSTFYGFNEEDSKKAVAKYRERYTDIGIFENAVYDGIPELLAKLRTAGKTLCIATSKPEVYTLRIVEHFGIGKYFDCITGSRLDGTLDNKTDVIRELFKRVGIKDNLDSVVMIGDRYHDIDGAKNCGIESIGVEYGFAEENELKEHGAEYIVKTVAELGEILL